MDAALYLLDKAELSMGARSNAIHVTRTMSQMVRYYILFHEQSLMYVYDTVFSLDPNVALHPFWVVCRVISIVLVLIITVKQ